MLHSKLLKSVKVADFSRFPRGSLDSTWTNGLSDKGMYEAFQSRLLADISQGEGGVQGSASKRYNAKDGKKKKTHILDSESSLLPIVSASFFLQLRVSLLGVVLGLSGGTGNNGDNGKDGGDFASFNGKEESGGVGLGVLTSGVSESASKQSTLTESVLGFCLHIESPTSSRFRLGTMPRCGLGWL